MKILSWMQRKLVEKHGTRKQNSISATHHYKQKEPQRVEFSDWPHGLLAIGTFGYNNLKEEPKGCKSSAHDHLQEITPEKVGELQKELKSLLNNQVSAESSLAEELIETYNLPILDNDTCPLSLDDYRINSHTSCGDLADKDDHLQHSSSIVLDKGKDVRLDQTNNAIGKKSFSFLLNKIFICHSGFAPAPSLRDPLPQSRIKKIWRAIVNKKIYPQSSSPKATGKKYLENKCMAEIDNKDEQIDKANDGSKWVKTDSEYIVLEI